MTGKDKIPILLVEKSQDLIKLILPKITDIVIKIGIENIGQPDVKLPDICLPASEIKPLIDLRNNIIDKLNSVSKTIENLSKPLTPLNKVVNTTTQILQTLSTAVTVAQTAIPLLPTPPPGAPNPANIALIALGKIQDLERKLFPEITKTKNSINNITDAVDHVNLIISKILNILNSIDKYLIKCKPTDSPDLVSLNTYLTTVVDNANKVENAPILSENYKGFILDIVEQPFSSTTKRSKAVAKNNSGIILLQTSLSFTSTPQVLIEELKLIIDKNNLRAD
jgi:hypothetical protein